MQKKEIIRKSLKTYIVFFIFIIVLIIIIKILYGILNVQFSPSATPNTQSNSLITPSTISSPSKTDSQILPSASTSPKDSPLSSPSTSPSPSCEWSQHFGLAGWAWGKYSLGDFEHIPETSYLRTSCQRDPPTWNNNCCTTYCTEKIRAEAIAECQKTLTYITKYSCKSPCRSFLNAGPCTIFESQSSVNGYFISADDSVVHCGCSGQAVAFGDAFYGCRIKRVRI